MWCLIHPQPDLFPDFGCDTTAKKILYVKIAKSRESQFWSSSEETGCFSYPKNVLGLDGLCNPISQAAHLQNRSFPVTQMLI